MKWEGPSHSYEGRKEGMILIWEISQRTHIYPSTPIIIIILFFFLCVLAWSECDPRPCPSVRPSLLPFVAFGPSRSYWQSGQKAIYGAREKIVHRGLHTKKELSRKVGIQFL